MNQIRFDCPGCGQTIEAPEEAQFERVRCPTCQHEFFPDKTRFVSPAPAAPPPQPASPAPTLPIQQQALKLVNCLACGLQISPQATSCPGCGHPVTHSPMPIPPDTRRKDAAVSSLILGILSLLFFGILTGIPAIILGHKAHSRARKSPAQYAGGGMAIAGFVMGYISSLMSIALLAMLLPALSAAKNKAQIINSTNNLKIIGLAFQIWAGDNNDQFPFNVSQAQGGTLELCDPDSNGFEKNPAPIFMVISNELEDTKFLVCPNDKTKKVAANFASLTANNISYQLRTGTNVNANNPMEILAVDPINGIVLYCDGRVERDLHFKKAVSNH